MTDKQENKQNGQGNNPLHGVRLVDMLVYLMDKYGWKKMGERVKIRCFTDEPSINSSLKFLRITEWAREKVEEMYLSAISNSSRPNV
ncbi:MAG: VF530 family protein [Cyclobacteriaceae bacterium]